MSNIALFPNWKRPATAAERFDELAAMARTQPQRFSRVLVVFEEDLPDNRSKVRWVSTTETAREELGMLCQAEHEISLWARGIIP